MADCISNYAKIGKEEIKLDPLAPTISCSGVESTALTLNDLMFRQEDGTYIKASTILLRDPVPITSMSIDVGTDSAVLTWEGRQDVEYFVDADTVGVSYNSPARSITLQGLLVGQHSVTMRAVGTTRTITLVFTIGLEAVENIQVSYGGGTLNNVPTSQLDIQVSYGGGTLNNVPTSQPDIQISYN